MNNNNPPVMTLPVVEASSSKAIKMGSTQGLQEMPMTVPKRKLPTYVAGRSFLIPKFLNPFPLKIKTPSHMMIIPATFENKVEFPLRKLPMIVALNPNNVNTINNPAKNINVIHLIFFCEALKE